MNAQGETLLDGNVWKDSFSSRRCLIPVDSFIEWQTDGKTRHVEPGNAVIFFVYRLSKCEGLDGGRHSFAVQFVFVHFGYAKTERPHIRMSIHRRFERFESASHA